MFPAIAKLKVIGLRFVFLWDAIVPSFMKQAYKVWRILAQNSGSLAYIQIYIHMEMAETCFPAWFGFQKMASDCRKKWISHPNFWMDLYPKNG